MTPKILIIDDDAVLRAIAMAKLAEEGFLVIEAEDSATGIQLVLGVCVNKWFNVSNDGWRIGVGSRPQSLRLSLCKGRSSQLETNRYACKLCRI